MLLHEVGDLPEDSRSLVARALQPPNGVESFLSSLVCFINVRLRSSTDRSDFLPGSRVDDTRRTSAKSARSDVSESSLLPSLLLHTWYKFAADEKADWEGCFPLEGGSIELVGKVWECHGAAYSGTRGARPL